MQYSLFPFEAVGLAGGPDLRSELRKRGSSLSGWSGLIPWAAKSGAAERGSTPPRPGAIRNIDLLDATVEMLRGLPWEIRVDFCQEFDGNLRLAVVARNLSREVEKGDRVHAGFFVQNSESGTFPATACERVFRVACSNGYMIECERGQSVLLASHGDWRSELSRVADRSFVAEGLDRDIARFRTTTTQMLVAPYEVLCNLVAQGHLSEEEQSAVQYEFDREGDATWYGLINAVTRIAGRCRESDEWKRSVELERLGGEILRGDHQPPVLAPVYS